MLSINGELRRTADSFLTLSYTRHALSLLRERSPELVEALSRRLDPAGLTAILRELVRERVPIRDLAAICEGILALTGAFGMDTQGEVQLFPEAVRFAPSTRDKMVTDLDRLDYVSGARVLLRRTITHALTGGSEILRAYVLARPLEQRLRGLGDQPLDEQGRARFVDAVAKTLRAWDGTQPPIIITASDIRRSMRRLIEVEFPHVSVISSLELPPEKTLQVLGEIPGIG